MKIINGKLNQQYIESLLTKCIDPCIRVKAAIAYASNDNMRLFEACINHKRRLDFWGRIDHTVPISPPVLKWFLDQPNANIQCKLVPNILHSKVIWWVGAGAYIGSANLTDRAWVTNIETGVFLDQSELEDQGVETELEKFFDSIDEHSFALTSEIYSQQLKLYERRQELERQEDSLAKDFNANALFSRKSIVAVDKVERQTKKYVAFHKEWFDTLEVIRKLSIRAASDEYRPDWVAPSVPAGVVVDRFLHLYYDNKVAEGNKRPYEEHHELNFNDPENAVLEALKWWKLGQYNFEYESKIMHEWAPSLQTLLNKNTIFALTEEQFADVIYYGNATRTHARQSKKTMLGLPPDENHTELEMSRAFAKWLWNKRSKTGKTPIQTIEYVLWGSGDITKRLWDAKSSEEWHIPHLGISALGEMIGWATPDIYPPRNERTSKTLRALGYEVEIHL
jgi:PLD-like domain